MSSENLIQQTEHAVSNLFSNHDNQNPAIKDTVKRDAVSTARVLARNGDEFTFEALKEHVPFGYTVSGEFTPEDLAYAAYARRMSSKSMSSGSYRTKMQEHSELTPDKFVILYDSVSLVRPE